jgi:hypothetical protein
MTKLFQELAELSAVAQRKDLRPFVCGRNGEVPNSAFNHLPFAIFVLRFTADER